MAASQGILGNLFGGSASNSAALGVPASKGMGSLLGNTSLFSLGSLASTGLQAYTAMQNAKMQSNFLKLQAMQEESQAKQVQINAEEQANQIRRKLLDDMASASAFFAARGMNSSGSALNAEIQSRKNANEDLDAILSRGRTQAAGVREQARQTQFEAKAVRRRGLLNALDAFPKAMEAGGTLYGQVKGGLGG